MEEINPQFIGRVLAIYNPDWRFLHSAQRNDNIYCGSFNLNNRCPYLSPEASGFDHATELELDACLSQLCYVSIADLMSRNQIPELEGSDFSVLQQNGILTIDSVKKFRRDIPRGKFNGELALEGLRNEGILVILNYAANLENKSMIANPFRVVVKK